MGEVDARNEKRKQILESVEKNLLPRLVQASKPSVRSLIFPIIVACK